ncbi:allantoinase AllB [Alkalicoccus halolimnae]|uniref:Allantoinase AllB n=1 Tax=Alkalicoccus halolimnae TaxID=1667239 RepID=A0AAJ8LVX9_9BACI|nr:allantoinase AllB [Alkalicoccus halolimnae]
MELLIQNAEIYRGKNWETKDLFLKDGKIQQILPKGSGRSENKWNAAGQKVLPGLLDIHVHLNEPGRADWEGMKTGTAALAAGGVTTFFDMPLNCSPPTATAERVREKQRLAERKSLINSGWWGALLPGHLKDLPEMKEAGVIGFKTFMSASGIEEFPHAEDGFLLEGMEKIASLGMVLAVHAESNAVINYLTAKVKAENGAAMLDYAKTRPPAAEAEAVQRILAFAEVTGCSVHICHVSSEAVVRIIAEAKRRGIDVTAETCPHYLCFSLEEAAQIGSAAKCAPPIRSDKEALWQALRDGDLDFVSSDHSPSPPHMKKGNLFDSWGGVAGAQQTIDVLLTEGFHKRNIPLEEILPWVTTNPAARFGFRGRKGQIEEGADADLTIVNTEEKWVLKEEDLYQRHKVSPYLGKTFTGKVTCTIVGGIVVYKP